MTLHHMAQGFVLKCRRMAMMSDEQLFKLPVYTKSGLHLGRLVGFEIEIESQMITHYQVRPKGLSARLFKTPLLVAREQVVSITEEKMIVEDNVEKAIELEKAKAMGLVSNTTEA